MSQGKKQFHRYDDELTVDENVTDPIMNEETDDPTKILQVPADKFKEEMDNIDIDDGSENEDMREKIEDRDEDTGQNRS